MVHPAATPRQGAAGRLRAPNNGMPPARVSGRHTCRAWSGTSPDVRSLLGAALARGEHLVDQAVLDGLGGGEDLVALDVVADLLGGATGVLGPGLLEPGAHAQHLV